MTIVECVSNMYNDLVDAYRFGADRGKLELRRGILTSSSLSVGDIDKRIGDIPSFRGLKIIPHWFRYVKEYYFPNGE